MAKSPNPNCFLATAAALPIERPPAKYANELLLAEEENAWAQAVVKKHEDRWCKYCFKILA